MNIHASVEEIFIEKDHSLVYKAYINKLKRIQEFQNIFFLTKMELNLKSKKDWNLNNTLLSNNK